MDPLDTRRNRKAKSNVAEPLRESASQTAGPYVHIGCLPNMAGLRGIYPEDFIHNQGLHNQRTVTITGKILDGDGVAGKDMMVELWHADETGSYENGIWRRCGTDFESGQYTVETSMPGATTDADGNKLAPFASVWVVARGINVGLLTRVYFPDFADANAEDPHLALVDEARRNTLVAKRGEREGEYVFDIVLQGDGETVFFET